LQNLGVSSFICNHTPMKLVSYFVSLNHKYYDFARSVESCWRVMIPRPIDGHWIHMSHKKIYLIPSWSMDAVEVQSL
jgi:hypothetical protein